VLIFILHSAAWSNEPTQAISGQDRALIGSLPEKPLTFDDVRPVLEQRCIVCHGCYDAPCQLKLTAFAGLQRGASKLKVYNKKRFDWQQPTRLFIDANSEAEWREKKFFGVLGNGESQSPEENLNNSLLYKMINLKQRHPLDASAELPDVSLERKQVCTERADFDHFAADHPDWGMPYALPGLSDEEYALLVQWLAQGAQASPEKKYASQTMAQVRNWEAFFNGRDNKKKLVSRYIFEHLVLGHIHFKHSPKGEFFRLVRSRSKTGVIDEIPSIRPYDDPDGAFYYRLRPYRASIVDKSHIVYELSDARMRRYKALFLQDDYQVNTLPGYNAGESSASIIRTVHRWLRLTGWEKPVTPFEVFSDIPLEARYAFLLDDARFFINGFIKGPVCRGLGALGSIEDQFWVFFLKPENPDGIVQHGLNRDFLRDNDNLLHLPTELGDTKRILNAWLKYWPDEQKYMQAKLDYYQHLDSRKKLFPIDIRKAIEQFVWNGKNPDGTINPNATLTVFRNLDSAAVHYGLLGDEPETAWMLDYPVFERLHYLLVAGYNTFGTLGHQASARLYMDFLRMEGEDNFLFFLPTERRKALYQSWHGVNRISTRKQKFDLNSAWLNASSVTGYANARKDEQHQFFKLLRTHVAAKSPDAESLNRCNDAGCFTQASEKAMQRLANLNNASAPAMPLQYFPALSYVRIGDTAYTMIYNKTYRSYKKDSFIKKVFNRSKEDMRGDTLAIVRGLAGAYPNFFFDLKQADANAFVDACEQIRSQEDYDKLVETFGVRRASPDFWNMADWFQLLHARNHPVEGGILDLSRYNVLKFDDR